MKKMNNKGFTLAELLIVVAIIAVLVAIAIPVFSSRLEQSRETTDIANLRSAYAAGQIALLSGDENGSTISTGTVWKFNPNAKIGLDSDGVSIGQGTATDGKADITHLPANVTYNTASNVKDKVINVSFGDGSISVYF